MIILLKKTTKEENNKVNEDVDAAEAIKDDEAITINSETHTTSWIDGAIR